MRSSEPTPGLCPPSHTFCLSDAIRLHTVTTDRFKTAHLHVYTVVPMDRETTPLMTLLFGLASRGTERYPSLNCLNQMLDDLYGAMLRQRNFHWADNQVLGFAAEMMEEAFLPAADRHMSILGGVMEVLSQMLLYPLTDSDGLLRSESVEKEKQALCDSIRSESNHPRMYAENRYHELLYAGEPYALSLLGEAEDVGGITPSQVTDTWRRCRREARVEVIYVGRTEPEAVLTQWQNAFSGWNPACLPLPPMTPHRPPAKLRHCTEDRPASQGRLCMGWTSGITEESDPQELSAALVLNQLLGDMPSSLLFRHVREEKGLCYACDSSYDSFKGVLNVFCGIRSDRRNEAEQAILTQLEALRRGEINERDMTLARLSLINEYRQIADSPGSLAAFRLWRVLLEQTDTPDDWIRSVRTVTATQVQKVAEKLTPDTVYFMRGVSENGIGSAYEED